MKKLFAVFTAVFMVVLSVSPAFAFTHGGTDYGSATTEMESLYEQGYKYATACTTTEGASVIYHIVLSTAPFKVNDVNGTLYATTGLSYYKYVWSNKRWSLNNMTIGNPSTLGDNQQLSSSGKYWYPLWASYDLYDNGGKLAITGDKSFFPVPPLAEMIQEVTAETLGGETVPAVTGTMRTLALCGVGCLALLTGLVLLSRKFWTFL